MSSQLEWARLVVEVLKGIAWPLLVLTLALVYRRPLYALLSNIGGIAHRAVTDSFELSLGEKLRVAFRESISDANPQTVAEAIAVAEENADKALTLLATLKSVPLSHYERRFLFQAAEEAAREGSWTPAYPDARAQRAIGSLVTKGLLEKDESGAYRVHPLVAHYVLNSYLE
ncbi:MAG TPA: hypothetical protein VNN25_00740 [Thermoanaerobaculia bacterium]|nr:hypothetical protein [Thermoanaerobaculia bacterium]